MRVSTRHEGDLDKQLLSFSQSGKTAVTLVLDSSANYVAVQHTAWMLANLAARLDGYVECVCICCPENIQIHPNIIPFNFGATDFGKALVSAVSALGIIPVFTGEKKGLVFYVGPGAAIENCWRVHGEGWVGGISKSAIIDKPNSSLPFGPYVAACFAAAEIFKEMRMTPKDYLPNEGFFDAWNLAPIRTFCSSEQPALSELGLECTLAGVGAVGTAFIHTMFACPMIKLSATIADNDSKGLDITNLNRYVLFGKSEIGKLKPDAVCDLLKDSHIRFFPWNNGVETLAKIGPRVLSAVDKNKSREGIQYSYPSRIISASTLGLRAEVLRCGPPGEGACLRCYNAPEVLPSDDEKIAKLKKAPEDEIVRFCKEAGISIEEGKAWINKPKCGQPGELLLSVLPVADDEQGVFSVGFTSVFAGVLLAVEFLKDCMGITNSLNGRSNHFTFQFFDVMSPVNEPSFLSVDPNCPLCHAKTLPIWKQRFENLKPTR